MHLFVKSRSRAEHVRSIAFHVDPEVEQQLFCSAALLSEFWDRGDVYVTEQVGFFRDVTGRAGQDRRRTGPTVRFMTNI